MKNGFLALINSNGETSRVTPYTGEDLILIHRHDQKRIELVHETSELEENEIAFEKIADLKKSSVGDILAKGAWGQLKHVELVGKTAPEAQEKKEDNKRDFFFFLKWTAAAQVSALVLIMVGHWIFDKYMAEPEAQIVTVFKREDLKIPTPVVAPSRKPVKQIKITEVFRKNPKAKVKKVAVRQTGRTNSNNIRTGNDLKKMGALSAFGGMSKSSTGLGGLNNTPSKSAGFAYDSNRARGGSSRGMLGKGLVQAGIGGGETLQGYGGYGTSGKGQGQAGYGSLNMAGRSGGYYLPLSEDAVVEGGLDRDQINAVVRRNQGQVAYCYERGLQSEPDLSGIVGVKFVIAPSGSVSIANVAHTSLDSKKVEACIVMKLRGWKFPKPKGSVAVKVTYPFTLKRLNQG